VRILLVDNSPGMGGSVRIAAALMNGLAERGVEVAVLASRPDVFAPLLGERVRLLEVGWPGFRDVFAAEHGLFQRGLPLIGQALALRRFAKRLTPEIARALAEWKPELVHLNNLNLPNLPVMEAVRRAGLPFVTSCQMIRFFGRREEALAARAARVICVSQAVRSHLLTEMRLDPLRVVVVPNGVDPAAFAGGPDHAWRREVGLPDDAPVACLLGRLTAWKGHHVAIAAWRVVRQKTPGALLAIVGDGEPAYAAQCRALAGRLGLGDAVRFIGHRDDVSRVLHACDLLVHASCYDHPSQGTVEAFGLVVIEAMAAGLPVVATAAGGVTEVVERDVTGKLVRPGDPDALAEAIAFYLNDHDAALEAGLTGRRRVREWFTLERSVEQLYDVYEQVLGVS
jgi:glycosyltransferase involved in cell wall biosynthesis